MDEIATIRGMQAEAWRLKGLHGFNRTDVPLNFALLVEEVGEVISAWRKGKPDYPGELADVAIFLVGIAEMTGVDLQEAVQVKLAMIAGRSYRPLANGTLVKESPDD